MKKFSKIVENKESDLVRDPKKSLKNILDYLFEGNEERNFFDYIREYVDHDVRNSAEFNVDFDEGTHNWENFEKFLKIYELEEDAQGHIYYDMMVMSHFSEKLKPTVDYVKKINEN